MAGCSIYIKRACATFYVTPRTCTLAYYPAGQRRLVSVAGAATQTDCRRRQILLLLLLMMMMMMMVQVVWFVVTTQ